jgi:hypothetical protein
MILGKEETFGMRPFLYHQKSSFFSVKDREAALDQNNNNINSSSNEPIALSKKSSDLAEGRPHYVAPTTSSLARSKSIISTSCLSSQGMGWSRVINHQQIHVNQLRKRQREQLKPFFLAKSKFLVKEPSSKAEMRREKVLSVNRASLEQEKEGMTAADKVTKVKFCGQDVELDAANEEKCPRELKEEEAPEPVELTADELELIRESQGKCSAWLERHVLTQSQRLNVLKQKQFNF